MGRFYWATGKIGAAMLAVAMAFITVSISAGQAHASAKQCSYLQRQLASASGGGSSNWAKYDQAATKQSTEIWYVKRDMRRAGCNSSNSRKCRTMKSTLNRMNANYKALIRKRESFRGGGSSSKRRAIQRQMAALNCSGSGAANKSVVVNRTQKREKITVPAVPKLGGYRTMCVRTCDGYYFPVSHASTKSDFKRDQAICNSLCPAAESKLFVHRNADQESEDMVSLRGEPYTSLPTAFSYRKVGRQPSCSCGAADQSALNIKKDGVAAEQAQTVKADPFLKKLPAPAPRPDLYADVETQTQTQTGLTAKIVRQFVSNGGEDEILASAQSRKIRVVGVEFLPDPATAIDLQAPAPTRVQ